MSDGILTIKATPPDQGSVTSFNPSLRYMPGLDLLRGIAIAMVLVYHGTTTFDPIFHAHHTPLDLGIREILLSCSFGVHLFFVLSGFLITGILIDSRHKSDYFRNFYLRRILRIVPAYLVVLLILVSTHYITWRYFAVSLIYFCNMTGVFGVNTEFGPLWSLSVEEQFYVVWPLVVRKLSVRHLAWFSVGLVLGSPILRLALLYGPNAVHDVYYKTWAVLDFFGAGALIAISVRMPLSNRRLTHAVTLLLFGGALSLALQRSLPAPHRPFLQRFNEAVWMDPWILFFSGLTLLAYLMPRIASLAVAKPLIFLAKISYSLYLYHSLIFELTFRHWPSHLTASMNPLPRALLQFFVEAILSIVVAALSRYTLEEYFLRLKPSHPRTPQLHSVTDRIA